MGLKRICLSLITLFTVVVTTPKIAVAASVGEKDNPLITLKYLQAVYQYKRVTLKKKQLFYLSPGSEFIILTGKVVSLQTDRMIDVSKGIRLNRKSKIEKNHLYITLQGTKKREPCRVVAKTNVTLIVRGLHTAPK